jgi:D-3-phosphoglycerate dehydrogenase
MSVTVLTTSAVFGTAGNLPARIAALGLRLIRSANADQAAHLPEADFLIAGMARVDAAALDLAPRLRGVLRHGSGTSTVDIAACTARGVPVTNTPGANALAVAELALAHIFALSRNLVPAHRAIVSGGWDRRIGREVQGATLAIIGFGATGRLLAEKATALGMRVLVNSRRPDPAAAARLGVTELPLDQALAQADHVSLHVSGGAETAGLIGAVELARMKPGATILNLARGEVLDLDALAAALARGHLSGAALDAYETEPPDRRHPVFADPRVIFSPHSGGDTEGALIRIGHMVLDDIETLLAGGQPARTINPDVFRGKTR